MLCQICPKRSTCICGCSELEIELKKLEVPMFKHLKSPRQIENILIKQYRAGSVENTPEGELEDFENEKEKALKVLDEALSWLAPGYQECIRMYYWEGLSYSQIGEKLGISHQAVSKRMNSAFAKIRDHFLTASVPPGCRFDYSRRVRVQKEAA